MKEKITRKIIEIAFISRYWVVGLLIIALIYLTYYVSHQPNIDVKDTVSVFTAGCVVITLFYAFINYEYTQRKFKHDVKTSKDLLSFNTALEWQKDYMVTNQKLAMVFYLKYKSFLDDNTFKKFQAELDKDENIDTFWALNSVLNFLEYISLGVKQGILDEDFIFGFFGTLFKLYCNRYLPYIEYRRRERQNQKIWHNFTELSSKWLHCK